VHAVAIVFNRGRVMRRNSLRPTELRSDSFVIPQTIGSTVEKDTLNQYDQFRV
jgi:hypothetical protein